MAASPSPSRLEVTSHEGIPERTLEHTIKETVHQIGARIVAEDKEQ